MVCGRCGNDDRRNYIESGVVTYVDETYHYAIGKCTRCGELLGTKEVYTYDHSETMSIKEIKELSTML